METTILTQIYNEPGVGDLKGKQRVKFAQAIKAEREGDDERAAKMLDEAVAEEPKK